MSRVVGGVLLRPMGISEPDRLVVMWPTIGESPADFSHNGFRHLAQSNATLDAVAISGSANWPARFVVDETVVDPHGAAVSWTFFDVLGGAPAIGRTFRADDDVPGTRQVIVISDDLWSRYFGRDSRRAPSWPASVRLSASR